jgi:hypothetical protein
MKRWLSTIVLATFVTILAGGVAAAQSKTIPGEMKTLTGTVEAVDPTNRTVTLKTSTESKQINVPPEVKNFPGNVKVGDRLTLRYYDNIVLIVRRPNEPRDPSQGPVGTGGNVVTPGVPGRSGTIAKQRTSMVTITAIDTVAPSVTFTDPEGKSHTSEVKDKKALSQVKVGDKVEITWTTAVVAQLDPAK